MWNQSYQWISILMLIIIMSFLITYNHYCKTNLNVLIIDHHLTVNQTNINTISTHTHRMFQDPEANICSSLKSLSMPEEIINLKPTVDDRQPLDASLAPRKVTFNQLHSILYGDPSTKLIYQNGRKYIKRKDAQSYPHTSLTIDIFTSIINRIDPVLKLQFIVEVGSFTGNSASVMGNVMKHAHPESFILCIDNWLGDSNMPVNKVVWDHLSVTEDGRPIVCYQFLANIIEQNLTDTVLPVPMSSITGASFLQTFQFRPQLIYLDSAHEQREILIELVSYWNILQSGGILVGDDWRSNSVRCDVKKFMYMKNLAVEQFGNLWIIKKPLDSLKLSTSFDNYWN